MSAEQAVAAGKSGKEETGCPAWTGSIIMWRRLYRVSNLRRSGWRYAGPISNRERASVHDEQKQAAERVRAAAPNLALKSLDN